MPVYQAIREIKQKSHNFNDLNSYNTISTNNITNTNNFKTIDSNKHVSNNRNHIKTYADTNLNKYNIAYKHNLNYKYNDLKAIKNMNINNNIQYNKMRNDNYNNRNKYNSINYDEICYNNNNYIYDSKESNIFKDNMNKNTNNTNIIRNTNNTNNTITHPSRHFEAYNRVYKTSANDKMDISLDDINNNRRDYLSNKEKYYYDYSKVLKSKSRNNIENINNNTNNINSFNTINTSAIAKKPDNVPSLKNLNKMMNKNPVVILNHNKNKNKSDVGMQQPSQTQYYKNNKENRKYESCNYNNKAINNKNSNKTLTTLTMQNNAIKQKNLQSGIKQNINNVKNINNINNTSFSDYDENNSINNFKAKYDLDYDMDFKNNNINGLNYDYKNHSNILNNKDCNIPDIPDKQFLEELRKILGSNNNRENLKELSITITKNKIKEEFLKKTTTLCKTVTKTESEVNTIQLWRWIKNLLNENLEYKELKLQLKGYANYISKIDINNDDKQCKEIISKCIDKTFANRKKIDKVKKLLFTEPKEKSRSKSKNKGIM